MAGNDNSQPAGGSAPSLDDPALLAECYEELRRTARRLLATEGRSLMLQPTELAHEAAIRLLNLKRMSFNDRGHLFATAARLTRQALIDEARRLRRAKRQMPQMLTLMPGAATPVPLEELHVAIEALARVSPEHAQIVELRFTLGMTVEETAATTGLSVRTVKRRWAATRAWLLDRLEADAAAG